MENETITGLRAALAEMGKEAGAAAARAYIAEGQVGAAQAEARHANERIARVEADRVRAFAEAERAKAEAEKANERYREAILDASEFRNRVEAYEKATVKHAREMAALTATHEVTAKRCAELDAEVTKLRAAAQERILPWQHKHDEMVREVRTLKIDAEVAHKARLDAMRERDTMKAAHDDAWAKHAAMRAELDAMKKQTAARAENQAVGNE